jgi:TatD DNase family protein
VTPDLVDTHAHLTFPEFAKDLPEVLFRARAAGVRAIVTVGTDVETSRAAVALANDEPDVWATVGIHPHDAETADAGAIAEIERLARAPRVVAVGEIGLDYFRNLSPREAQHRTFARLLAVARDVGKPVVIHCRATHRETAEGRAVEPERRAAVPEGRAAAPDAYADLLEALAAAGVGDVGGVMHCFSGDVNVARRALDLGLVISIAGPVTYPNARMLPDVVRFVPSDRLVVETDCPYLPPQPWRGKRNEPGYVAVTAARVATLRGEPFDVCAGRMSETARRLFRIPADVARLASER